VRQSSHEKKRTLNTGERKVPPQIEQDGKNRDNKHHALLIARVPHTEQKKESTWNWMQVWMNVLTTMFAVLLASLPIPACAGTFSGAKPF